MAYVETRKSRDGRARYRVQVRKKGYPTQTATFSRLTDARKWARDTEADIEAGRHFKTAEAKRHTLKDLIDRYLAQVARSLKSASDRRRHLDWWRSQLGNRLLADISPALIAEYRDRLLEGFTVRGSKRSNSTVVRYLASLSHAFTVAMKEWGWVEENPLRKVTKPKEPRGRIRFLSDDERAKLLSACRASSNPYLYPVVVLALSTGMRQGEIMNLRLEDIDFQRGRITLHDTKNNERRVVPLVGHALDVLMDHAKVRRLDCSLLFPSRGPRRGQREMVKALKPMELRAPWTAALKEAGIADFRFHDLRHSCASYLAMNGASLAEIAEVLGHKTLQMVKRYAHLSESHTTKVVASMNERIFN